MRILLCHNNYRIIGGAEVFYHEVARILSAYGHDIAMFSCRDEGIDSKWAGYFPKRMDYTRDILHSVVHFNRFLYSRDAKHAAAKLVDDFKPDIVHCFSIYSGLTPSILDIFREKSVPVVSSLNDYKHICPNYKLYHHAHLCEECKDKNYYHAILNRCSHNSLIYSTAHAIESYAHDWMNIYKKNIKVFLFASMFMANITEEFWGKGTFQWRLLRNPFNSKKYALSKSYEDYFLYFGRIIEEKGVDILIRAMQAVPEAKLRIVGEGPQEQYLQRLCSDLHVSNVVFLGPKWNEEMDRLLAHTRFTAIPSMWHENYPYVILQSFANGKAVIGSNRGGISELVKHGQYGLIYDANNVNELAGAIRELWNDPLRTVAMGAAAKEYANREFNDNIFYNNLIKIYKEALS